MDDKVRPILVAACGNAACGDDAFGPLVAQHLRRAPLAAADVIDLDTNPATLLGHLAERRALIVVDAAHLPDTPAGRLIDADWFSPDRPRMLCEQALSSHGLSLAVQLDLARTLGLLPPRVHLVAVTVDAPTVGQPTSTAVARQARRAARLIAAMVKLWLSPTEVPDA